MKKNCPTAKVRHETEEDAMHAKKVSFFRNSPPLYIYSCWQCDGWHLTRTAPKKNSVKRRK